MKKAAVKTPPATTQNTVKSGDLLYIDAAKIKSRILHILIMRPILAGSPPVNITATVDPQGATQMTFTLSFTPKHMAVDSDVQKIAAALTTYFGKPIEYTKQRTNPHEKVKQPFHNFSHQFLVQ